LIKSKDVKIKAIIIDLGNVLVDFNHRAAAEKLSKFTDKTGEYIYDLFFDSELTGNFEEARISPSDFFSAVKKALNLKIDYDQFVPIWNEIFFFSEKNLQVYNLALKVKDRYKIAILSNINILHLEYVKKTFPVLGAFQIFASCDLKLKKPQGPIYQLALKLLGVSPAEAFYTDDRPELVESAKILGIKSFIFSGPQRLKKDFLEAGININ